MLSMLRPGVARGYRRTESGSLEIVGIPVIDDVVVDGDGDPVDLGGCTIELSGWPDTRAIEIDPHLMVGIAPTDSEYILSVLDRWLKRSTLSGTELADLNYETRELIIRLKEAPDGYVK